MRKTILVMTALLVLAFCGPAQAANVLVVKGKGADSSGNKFSFKLKGMVGSAEFETASFGTPTGAIDCIFIVGPLVVMAGAVDVPTSGLTHFMVVAEDLAGTGDPDELALWLRNGPFDCEDEATDPDPNSLAAARAPISRGKIVLKIPPN